MPTDEYTKMENTFTLPARNVQSKGKKKKKKKPMNR